MSTLEFREKLFFNPPRFLLQVWRYAGPAFCCKLRVLARRTGIPSESSKLLKQRCHLPWKEWWTDLAKCHLITQLMIPFGDALSLDRAWILIQDHPEVVNSPMLEGRPIVVAVRNGRRDIAELLRLSGALLRGTVADELLYEAAASGKSECVKLLLFNSYGGLREEPWASVNARPKRHGGTPFDVAKLRGHALCEELLRKAGGRHSLHAASMYADPDAIRAWLEEGANVDERDGSGATPLWHAARGVTSGSRQSRSIKRSSEDEDSRSCCIKLLIEAQATIDALPITLETPLLVAARRGNEEHCSLLLHARASLQTRNRDGRTPLECAANEHVRNVLMQNNSNPFESICEPQISELPATNVFTSLALEPQTAPSRSGQMQNWALPYYTNSAHGQAFFPVSSAGTSHGFTFGQGCQWSEPTFDCAAIRASNKSTNWSNY